MELTKSQKSAVDQRNCSLLVSAGAGSGKTAVLTQRIINRLCDKNDDCNVTDFLVVTFTTAAAKELSDRIRKKLSDAAMKDPSNKKILRNIALLPQANISTINAFCYDVVRKNFQKLGLNAAVRIADDAEMQVIREKIMNRTLSDAFESEDKDFSDRLVNVSEMFSGARDDENFVGLLLGLDAHLRADTNPENTKRRVLSMYDDVRTAEDFFQSEYGRYLKSYSQKLLSEQLNTLCTLEKMCADGNQLENKYLPSVSADVQNVELLLKAVSEKDYTAVRDAVRNFAAQKLGSVRNYPDKELCEIVKTAKSECADNIRKKLADMYCADERVMRLCALDCSEVLRVMFALEDEFSRRLEETKNQLGILDFNDVEHLTIKLLTDENNPGQPSETALSLRERFKEIYIDEYQDVNPLQDEIFKLIARTDKNGTEKSRFMVGDIKQSIYRFRGARPDIFKSYRASFSDCDTDSSTKRIFMQDNFRCAQSVIELTNFLFVRLMGKDYEDGDALSFSRIETVPVKSKAELIVADCKLPEDGDEISTEQAEAQIIAQKILEVVNNENYRDGEGKTFGFSDVAVLTRSRKALKIYSGVLSEYGIPVYCDVGENFYEKKEILLALCILNSIDNPLRDIQLAGYMRSVPGGFSDDELCVIKAAFPKTKLYLSVKAYAETNGGTPLGDKCRDFTEKLDFYRTMSRGKNAGGFVWQLYTDADLLNICSSPVFNGDTPDVCSDRRRNLMKLYEMARSYTNTSFRGIGAFLEYIRDSSEKAEEKAQQLVGNDSVKLMTMHGSKGLEFPVCFVSSLASKFRNETQSVVMSYDCGIGMKLKDVEMLKSQSSATGRTSVDTPFRKICANTEKSAGIAEEMRILYVALTRARDYLFMTAAVKNDITKVLRRCYVNSVSGNFSDVSCYLEAVLNCIMNEDCARIFRETAGIPRDFEKDCFPTAQNLDNILSCVCFEYEMSARDTADEEDAEENEVFEPDKELLEKLTENGRFEYSDKLLTRLPSKLTVSQLKSGLLDDDGEMLYAAKRDLKTVPDFAVSDIKPNAGERGTAMHLFMQFADYEKCAEHGCEAEADRLAQEQFIDERTREMLDTEKLNEFFKTPLYNEIKNSVKVFRERRFNLETDASEFSENIEKDKAKLLVQGVIDLYFRSADGTYTVVDFKTDKVSGRDAESILINRHAEQLRIYCTAVERITKGKIKKAVIFSFELMKSIEVSL